MNPGFSGIKIGVFTHSLCCESISMYSIVSNISSETARSRGSHYFLTMFESFSEADLGKLRVNHPTLRLPQGGQGRTMEEKCACDISFVPALLPIGPWVKEEHRTA